MVSSLNNAIYLRRGRKIALPPSTGENLLPLNYVASVVKNLEVLGFTFSEPLIQECRTLSLEQLTELYNELALLLTKAKGAHHEFRPMYPNFPAQVMEMDRGELYINAIIHYLTWGRFLPATEREDRLPLLDNVELIVIGLGTRDEFEGLFVKTATSNTSLSEQDREDLAWFVEAWKEKIRDRLPATVKQKENMAYLAALLLKHLDNAGEIIKGYCRTATDLLRIAVALSGGDISLAQPATFRNFARAERRLLLDLLDQQENIAEDMLRWKDRWIRLGEKLHPGELRNRYPQAAAAFDIIRNDLPHATFNSTIESALAGGNTYEAVLHLLSRPGDFARRLDHLLRIGQNDHELIITAFASVADKVSTPVLLQAGHHFKIRGLPTDNHEKPRVFFPKGDLAKAYALKNNRPPISEGTCKQIVSLCEKTLIERFKALPPLGRCYLDARLVDYLVPFSQRSASRSLRTLVRGSKIPLPEECRVLRFFVWWKNGAGRTDIDLSATMFDKDFGYRDILSYYQLSNSGGAHSGDIVDAPNGASEFIDITIDKVLANDIRYVVMTLNSFTDQPYCDLPECFAGWMARTHPQSGEIYEPTTVQDRIDITANTRIAIPLIIDLQEKQVIWCDMGLRRNPSWVNNVHTNMKGVNLTLQALADLEKPSLHDLFALHIQARGEYVEKLELADTVFSVEQGTPFRLEEIASGFMG